MNKTQTADALERRRALRAKTAAPGSCQCGDVSGVQCAWAGPLAETVLVEWMPEYLRASHVAAGNAGMWPYNGAQRLRCERSCADNIVIESDGWAKIV